jgi:hypothetical protein
MNINRKYIIIFGTLVLLLVLIIGAVTYYKEKAEQAQTPDVKQDVLSFSRDYPDSLSKLSDFLVFCRNTILSDAEELKNEKIKEVVCTLERELRELVLKDNTLLVGVYTPSFSPLDSIISLKTDRYIDIAVDLKDVLREYDASLLEEGKLYFCSISEPSWADPFSSQMKKPKQTLIFDEGDVSCTAVNTDIPLVMYAYGFVPQAESLNIKQYLVDEQTVTEVMNKQSFSEIKEILKDYPIIWQMEKPIIP